MSPRSVELRDAATRRLTAAVAAAGVDPSAAVSLAYYAMLYAARAALSERDLQPRTHAGTWHEFRRVFVIDGGFDAGLAAAAQATQAEREQADYDAWPASAGDAERVIATAQRFIAAVTELVD